MSQTTVEVVAKAALRPRPLQMMMMMMMVQEALQVLITSTPQT